MDPLAESFVFLLARHERQIASYVVTLVPQASDAEDVLQEAKVVMWRNFASFEIGTNFVAWARRVAFNQILTMRKKRQRDRLWFSEEFLQTVADETDRASDDLEERRKRLDDCINKLQPEHRRILNLRYQQGSSIEDLAAQVGRTVAALYRLLSRLRSSLHACVGKSGSLEVADGPAV